MSMLYYLRKALPVRHAVADRIDRIIRLVSRE